MYQTKPKVWSGGRDKKNCGMSNPTQKCDAQVLFAANMRRIRKESS